MKNRSFFAAKVIVALLIVFLAALFSSCEKKHEFDGGTVTKQANCTEAGVITHVCAIHGDTYAETIPPLGHETTASTVEPSCEMYGYTLYTCSRCGETSVKNITAALGHDNETETVEPTCSLYGYTVSVCRTCGKSAVSNVVPSAGHEYSSAVVPPTCTDQGHTLYTCSRCGDSYSDTPVSPVGHDYAETVLTAATRISIGTKRFTCSRCGDTYTTSYSAEKISPDAIYSMAQASVGKITAYDDNGKSEWIGTCFAIGSDGSFVTNYHVVEQAYSLKVSLGGKEYDVTHILASDKDIDLAVIKVNGTGFVPLTLDKDDVFGGCAVYAMGNSKGYELSFTTGSVSYPDRVIDGVHYVQHDAAISHGNSGGPLFDEYGCVIGVNTWTDSEGQNINFAVSVKELDSLDYSRPITVSRFYEEYEGDYSVWIGDVKVSEKESNNTVQSAQSITQNGTTVIGVINGASDRDCFKVSVDAGKTLEVILYPEYALDASGILCALTDKDLEVLKKGEVVESSETDVSYIMYKNESSRTETVYIVLQYYASYKFKNDSANYALFTYIK